jgi:hypothetical protein
MPASASPPIGRAQRWAKIGITIQFLALVRILAEYFRLRHVSGGPLPAAAVDGWMMGGVIAAVLCWIAVTLFFFRRYRASVAAAVLTVAALLVYKLVWMD